ncbi:hypothetical protein BC830DRAFT_1100515 [Chytriomyces sp. MP71]|nr:hypothetical protein BC830DRAFT_1100515 [Chytriomyces sp. MP71]
MRLSERMRALTSFDTIESSKRPLLAGAVQWMQGLVQGEGRAESGRAHQHLTDVLIMDLARNKRSIWSCVVDVGTGGVPFVNPDPVDLDVFVRSEKRRRLRESVLAWRRVAPVESVLGNSGDNAMDRDREVRDEALFLKLLKEIASDPADTRAFCILARRIEQEIWLERGVEGETVFHYALLMRQFRLIHYFLGMRDLNKDRTPYRNYSAPISTIDRNGNPYTLQPFQHLDVLINKVYEGPTYHGEHALHIASVVFGDNVTYVKQLVAKGADPFICRARGNFFSADASTGSFYMGETVLAFAAVMGHQAIVDYFIHEVGVDPNQTDYNGNNVLHVLAWWGYIDNTRDIDKPQAFNQEESVDALFGDVPEVNHNLDDRENFDAQRDADLVSTGDPGLPEAPGSKPDTDRDNSTHRVKQIVVGHIYHQLETGIRPDRFKVAAREKYRKYTEQDLSNLRADDSQQNWDDFTPLIVAVNRGQRDAVEAILKYKAKPVWTYGSVERTRVCLSEIDTFTDSITMNHTEGALSIAVRNEDVQVLLLPVFRALLDAKWTAYAKRIFYVRFWSNFLYMMIFTAALWLLPNGSNFQDMTYRGIDRLYSSVWSPRDVTRIVLESMLIITNLYLFSEFVTQGRLLQGTALKGFSAQHNFLKYFNFVVFVVIVVLRCTRETAAESAMLIVYAALGWIEILYYFRGFRDVGPLVMVFWRIIQYDVVTFLTILLIVSCGFGPALWLQLGPYGDAAYLADTPVPGDQDWSSLFPGGAVWTVRLFFGQGAYDTFRNGSTGGFAIALFLTFFLVVNIILLNVFIAMIGSTFNSILTEAENRFYLSWASLIMEMDEVLNAKHKKMEKSVRDATRKREKALKLAAQKEAKIESQSSNKVDVQKQGVSRFEKGPHEHEVQIYGALQPITRIGIPRKTPVYSAKEKDKVGSAGVYIYDLHLEFHGADPKPKHIFASLDPKSPLSEIRLERKRNGSKTHEGALDNRRARRQASFDL